MSKRTFTSRYFYIIKKIQSLPYATFEQIRDYLEDKFEYLQSIDETFTGAISKRTFQRDIKDIYTLSQIQITYSRKEKGYFIENEDVANNPFLKSLETFEYFNVLNFMNDNDDHIIFEDRKPAGNEHLPVVLTAIKDTYKLSFHYKKYDENNSFSERIIEPYALKEFKHRWYVIGKDNKDESVKSFGIDRMENVSIVKKKYKVNKDYKVRDRYANSFGIVSPSEDDIEEIILSMNTIQAKYLKSLPLHASQKVISESKKEVQMSVHIYPTQDFLMEILSYGPNIKILKPKSLQNKMKKMIQKIMDQY